MARESKKRKIETPGTVVLAFIFLAWFLVMYFLGWVGLSGVWPVQ